MLANPSAIPPTAAGAPNGVATLDSGGKVPTSQLPAAVVGDLQYQGTWNASTNTPTLVSSTGTKGQYYKVATAGTTSINGIAVWNVGDLIVFNGSTWDKLDGTTDEVITFNGRFGVVSPQAGDYTAAMVGALPSAGGNLSGPVYPQGSIAAYGDSFTVGAEASNQATTAYIPLMAAAMGRSITNNAVGGSMVPDQLGAILSHSVAATDISVYMLGENDQSHYTTAPQQQIFAAGHLSEVVWLAIPNANKVIASDTTKVTYTGTWAAPGTNYGVRMASSVAASTATFSVYGSAVLVSMLVFDGSTGSYSISIDGINQGTFNCAGGGTVSTINGLTYGPNGLLFEGLSDGSHTVVITVVSAGSGSNEVFFDYAAGLGGTYGPLVLVGNILYNNATGYATYGGSAASVAAYNQIIAANVRKVRTYGLDVQLVDVAAQVNTTTMLWTDGRHPLDAGHLAMANTFLNSADVSYPSPQNAPGLPDLPTDYISGLPLLYSSNTQFAVGTGSAYSPAARKIITVAATLLVAPTLAASTWYYVYLTGPTSVSVTTSEPSDYQGYAWCDASGNRYIGCIRTDASGHIIPFQRTKGGRHLWVTETDVSPFRVLSGGTSTATSPPASIDCTAPTPPTATVVLVNILPIETGVYGAICTSSGKPVIIVGGTTTGGIFPGLTAEAVMASNLLYYYLSGSPGVNGLYVDVVGFIEDL